MEELPQPGLLGDERGKVYGSGIHKSAGIEPWIVELRTLHLHRVGPVTHPPASHIGTGIASGGEEPRLRIRHVPLGPAHEPDKGVLD
ncbi:MAG: hypothetical protein ACRDFX_14025, partial [Chloroflexota bacterium]